METDSTNGWKLTEKFSMIKKKTTAKLAVS